MRRRKRGSAMKVLLLLVIAAAVITYDSNSRIVSEEYVIESGKIPEAFDGYRIVQLSDLHQKVFKNDNSKLFFKVSELNPDIIAITGDIVQEPGQQEYVKNTVAALCKIAPVYYVTGNHEWATGEGRSIIAAVTEAGGKVLRGQYDIIERDGEKIVLAGVDDPNGLYDQKTPSELSQEVANGFPDSFSLLLAHRNTPEVYENLCFDVILCGHAHGGIIRLPIIGGLLGTDRTFFPDYEAGKYDLGRNTMIVSRGVGNGIAIPRFLNNPDIPVIVLKSI